jgi:hypothetical protein
VEVTATALNTDAGREIYLDRRICSITPDRIDVHPARSIVFLPLATLLVGIAIFPVIFFMGGSLPFELRVLLTLAAVVIVPLSGIGLVYSIAGAHLVIDRAKQSAVLQQGYLGMGVGTEELIPFWKVDHIRVQELTPHDDRGHQDDFAQYEVAIVKISGKEVPVGTITVARAEAREGLSRSQEIATLIAELTGSKVRTGRPSLETK